MLAFHVVLHPRSKADRPGPIVALKGSLLPTILRPTGTKASFARSFEEVAEALERLPRMFFEPDGSFVWVAPNVEPAWQLDGQLADRDGCVIRLELKGVCPPERFDDVLAALGVAGGDVAYELVLEGVHLADEAFRRYAAG